jgi:oxygen-independent coproporphyrinogen-3 oxidase
MSGMNIDKTNGVPPLTAELLERLDEPGPRYTSYPTADRFVEAFGPAEYQRALGSRINGSARNSGGSPLSVYVHIPFCESVCYYCGCNKIVTRHHGRASAYLDLLEAEIALHVAALGNKQPVSQLHLGGGTPTFLNDAEMSRLITMLRRSFGLASDSEVSIEVDPRTVDEARLAHLHTLGFNRLSFGVQDFDAVVQRAVHRVQSFANVASLLDAAKALRFSSTNMDLIYGLPQQTAASFERTIEQVCELRPDRIALYAYAHLPLRFKPQRRIDAALLPSPSQKIAMLAQAIQRFEGAGYVYVGMDHFALPDDALAVARRQGWLHRNFQGYSTRPDCDVIGLGVSSIGRVGATYSQNAKTLAEYADAISGGQFATKRGIALTRDDILRRAVIMALMCQGRVEFESISLAHLVDFGEIFKTELAALQQLSSSGLVHLLPGAIEITALGWYFVRSIAMVFDRHLQADRARSHFSRVI